MTEHLLTPESTLDIMGKPCVWSGDFSALKAIQHALKKDIVDVQMDIFETRLDEFALLLSVMAVSSGFHVKESEVGQWLQDEVGIGTAPFVLLKSQVAAAIAIALAPLSSRQKKREEMTQQVESIAKAAQGFRGDNTSKSA